MPRLTKKKVNAQIEKIKELASDLGSESAMLYGVCYRNTGKPAGTEYFLYSTDQIIASLNTARHLIESARGYLDGQFPHLAETGR